MKRAQREVFIEELYNRMREDEKIFFLTADLGSIQLDNIRKDVITKDRYINVGIAEQNLVNISFGLALEGFTVYAYAISAFLTMRAFEQIRNLSINIQGQNGKGRKDININLLGVGAGLSYDLSGPSHSCIEDISIMRTLPNIDIISPSDWVLMKRCVNYSLDKNGIKYIRFDGKSVEQIYGDLEDNIKIEDGFYELRNGNGSGICLVSTGYMTHTAIKVAEYIEKYFFKKIGVIDIFRLIFENDIEDKLFDTVSKRNYKYIITMEEGFINKGGLDSLISSMLTNRDSNIRLKRIGFQDKYEFRVGNREYLHKLAGLCEEDIEKVIIKELN